MLSEVGRIIFYEQKFGGIALPEGKDTSEEARLRAAITGVYELQFRQQPQYEFSGAFLFNDETTDAQRAEKQKQFEVSEEIAEAERTLTIQSTADGIDLDSLEMFPLDWRGNPLEFTAVKVSESERKITYSKDSPVESLKLKLSGVNVFEVESINAVLWANGRDYSPGKLAAFIKSSDDIRIDRLDNSQVGARPIEEHLGTFFRILLEQATDRAFDVDVNYRYPLAAGVLNAFLPVLFQRSLTLPTASEWFSSLLPALRNWYKNTSPPAGVFDFGVKVYGSREATPILQLAGVVLPIESIAGWSGAGSN